MGNIFAVDVGLSNGVAVLSAQGELLLATEFEPIGLGANKRLNMTALSQLCQQYEIGEAIIEDVSAMPKQGVSSTFRFGRAAGSFEGALQALGVSVEWVKPAIWKRDIGAKAKQAEDIRALAIQRWPAMAQRFERKKDHNRAEAALIGLWYIRKYMNQEEAA